MKTATSIKTDGELNRLFTMAVRGTWPAKRLRRRWTTDMKALEPWLKHFANVEVQMYSMSQSVTVRLRTYGQRCRWNTLAVGQDHTIGRAAVIAILTYWGVKL